MISDTFSITVGSEFTLDPEQETYVVTLDCLLPPIVLAPRVFGCSVGVIHFPTFSRIFFSVIPGTCNTRWRGIRILDLHNTAVMIILDVIILDAINEAPGCDHTLYL